MLRKIINIIFTLSCIGLITSIIVHILTISGIAVQDYFDNVWLLQIFGIGLAGITIVLSKTHEYQAKKNFKEKSLSSWSTILDGIPKLYIGLLILFAIYAFFHISVSLNYFGGNTHIENGQFVLMDHGRIIKKLTKLEYDHHRISQLRSFSSGWIAIFGLVFILTHPLARFWDKYKTLANNA